MFRLGNFNIDEILYGVAQNQAEDILYTLDQLSSAEISISAESTDITDKNGNVVRTRYTSKSGEFTATNAWLHPQIMNAASGSDIERATKAEPIVMPKVEIVAAGASVDLKGFITGSIKVIGLYGNGANSEPLTESTVAAYDEENGSTYKMEDTVITVPASSADAPIQYLVKYDAEFEDGIKLVNDAESFPDLVKLTLFCSYVDPCDDKLKSCVVVLPRFMASPEATISLDRETQEMDFNGQLNID